MRRLRLGLAVLLMGMLAVGYFASQQAALGGEAQAYARRVDTPSVKGLALAATVAVVALGFIPDRDAKTKAESD